MLLYTSENDPTSTQWCVEPIELTLVSDQYSVSADSRSMAIGIWTEKAGSIGPD